MQTKLVEALRIPATSSILLFDQLEDRGWLRFENNRWTSNASVDLKDDVGAFAPDFSSETPAIDLLKRARKLRATDVHIDPLKDGEYRVRFRIDGELRDYCRLDDGLAKQMLNRIKTLVGVDAADPFHPKEASPRLPVSDLDVRMTSIPVAGGNAMALRLFDTTSISLALNHLGFSDHALSIVQDILTGSEGLVLA